MGGEFRLHHGSATTEKAAAAAGRVEAIVGDVVNGNRRAWGRIDVEDIALLVQHARDAAASPDWLSKMAIDALVTRWETAKAERDGAIARAEAAEQRAEALAAEVARLRADALLLAGLANHHAVYEMDGHDAEALDVAAERADEAADGVVIDVIRRALWGVAEAQPAEVVDG